MLRDIDAQLAFCRNRVAQKERLQDVAWGLGSNGRLRGAKLQRWFAHRVEATSRSASTVPERPASVLAPAG